MAFCTNKCVDNLECVALDVCDFYGEEKSCRLVRSLKINLTTTDYGKTCRRYKMDKRCGDGELNEEILKRCILYLCDFETTTEPSCFLTETTDDIFNWSRKSGKTGSSSTGPNGAKVGTYYKFIEASSPRVNGQTAKLVSNKDFEDKAYCLSMYYHMYGQTTGTLKIQTRTGNDPAVTHWELSGNQGNQWYSIDRLNLPLNSNTKIIIEATRGRDFYSDISVDYIVLWSFACP
ncbi:MAM domain-containing glycosylphosphatidylinositol anchor protein 1-like [Saccostrea echinata]|uniref:MAM domain-containing glycosylphosphatidylinositol anchor protein 1-like n=1 Tax=Saccostrea echinata TaxID=191078 RepID=UPI002A819BDB|nr:MAM domain-containing glycosylphosphatidylinositol anchor protein 1-like [Saccostrea echinata]